MENKNTIKLTRIHKEGVGDDDGFYEIGFDNVATQKAKLITIELTDEERKLITDCIYTAIDSDEIWAILEVDRPIIESILSKLNKEDGK